MNNLLRFAIAFVATWLIVVLILTLYEGSTAEGYRTLDSKSKRFAVFAAVVALWTSVCVVAIGIPFPSFAD
jgi:hypothetical protein